MLSEKFVYENPKYKTCFLELASLILVYINPAIIREFAAVIMIVNYGTSAASILS